MKIGQGGRDGSGRRILVTGGAGFIGSHVATHLLALGWRVETLDNLSTGEEGNVPPGVKLHVADIRSRTQVEAVLHRRRFEAIVHCAAQTSVEHSMNDPEFDRQVNVIGTQHLLAAGRSAGITRFVFISSGGAIYGDTKEPATESTMPTPRSYYGLHKFVAEEMVRAEGLPFAVLRPSNVYGPGQRSDAEGGVVAIFWERLRAGQEIEIHGDGSQMRDFVHVSDVVAAVIAGLRAARDVLWNVASGEATTIIDLARAMAAQLERPLNIRFGQRRAGDVDRSLLSPAALLATGAWGPPVRLDEGLRLLATGPGAVSPAAPV